MRDIIIVSDRLAGMAGGEQRVLTTLANAWAEMGRKVIVLSFDKADAIPFFTLHSKIVFMPLAGTNSILTPSDVPKPPFLREAWANLRRIFVLHKTFKTLKASLHQPFIIAFGTYRSVISILANKGLSLPVICSEHTDPNRIGQMWGFFRNQFFRNAYKITALTDEMRLALPKSVQENCVIIPNPVISNHKESEKKFKIKKPFILTVGRFHTDKGMAELIEAFAKIAHRFDDWCLLIIGEGQERSRLEKLVQSLRLEKQILLPGIVHNIHTLYSEADIFVLNSLYEGFPMALLEAMTHGVASISTNCPVGGPAELIRDGENGILIPLQNNEKLSAALEYLIQNPSERKRLGDNAKEVVNKYSLPSILKEWNEIFPA